MFADLWNFLVWLATVDLMWISAGISVILFGTMYLVFKMDIDRGNKDALIAASGISNLVVWLMVVITSYGPPDNVPPRFPHFLLWHLVALGAVATGVAGWFAVKGLKKLWGYAKNLAKNISGKWQSKKNRLRHIRGTAISEELESRRGELEKLMDDGAISESIRAQVASLFGGPFKRLLAVRQFLLENAEIFDAAQARALKNTSASSEIKKEIAERRERLNKTLGDVNARLSQIAATVDGLIIRMAEIRAGLGQGTADVEATLNELNEMVSAI